MNKKILFIALVALVLLPLSTHAQWSAPTQTPPNGNPSAPLNAGSTAQSKVAGLLLNTGNFTNGLIVQFGNVGIDTTSPNYTLDVNGLINGTQLCISGVCRNSWPSSSSGTVTSITSGTGLTGSSNPITTSGTISLNTAGISGCTNSTSNKIYWNGSYLACGTDQGGTGTVYNLSQGNGISLSSNPITTSGTISADTNYVQRRLQSGCAGGQAIQSIDVNGNPTCISAGSSYTDTDTFDTVTARGGTSNQTLTINGVSTFNNTVNFSSGIQKFWNPIEMLYRSDTGGTTGFQNDNPNLNWTHGGSVGSLNMYMTQAGMAWNGGFRLKVFGAISPNVLCFQDVNCITASNADLTLNSNNNNSLFLGNATNGVKINQNAGDAYVKLFSNGSWWNLHNSGGTMYFSNNSGYNPLYLSGNTAYGNFVNVSDERLKKDITQIPEALNRVLKLKGVSYTWKSDNTKGIGLIAQDVEKVFPEVVKTDEKGIKGVNYGYLVGPLVEAIKDQQKSIDDLKAEVSALKAEVASLKK